MIIFNKKVGETPLGMINRIRVENPQYKNSKMSYAGRLDPMAEGKMIVLIDEENKNAKKYFSFDKEYVADFLIGFKTDTGDILGIIEKNIFENCEIKINQKEIEKEIKSAISNILKLKEQTYPWFSGATIKGIKLFEYFKKGQTNIERPKINIEIKDIKLIKIDKINKKDLEEYIYSSIKKVDGDFRQKEILESWKNFFKKIPDDFEFNFFRLKMKVSSGTFIRSLTENFIWPTVLIKLDRTNIFIKDEK